MPLNTARAREQLSKGDLRALFIDELGWDRHAATLEVNVDATKVSLQALAQKRGMVAYQCPVGAGQRLPDYAHRRKIEHQVARAAHEHLIVFTDAENQTQVWQWVKREPGKPAACREHSYHRSQPGDALLQKLEAIAFTLEEEERLSLLDVTRRARAGFDVERVTKRFYDRFQKEHTAFLNFISGITESTDREWYASVMLNRLMFVYFIQRKGFLHGERDYLRNRLTRMKVEHGKDKFYSFYRYFLLRLFHEGLGGRARPLELEKLVGRIPYLNGGLFDVHELEKPDRYGRRIEIPDQAFERIFDYFDQYQWHLDERPLRADNEINPDVLGYIFEKYVNQKQMGAYYTREDITEYISKNTVVPFLLDAARARCKVGFENPKGPTVWDLPKNDPDRYIYPAVRHGATWDIHSDQALDNPLALPEAIARGVNPPTLNKPVSDGPVQTLDLRKEWNKAAPPTHGLPTETWRELIARRKHYEHIRTKLLAGDVRDVNDLITLNLDIRQFAQDVIENCEGPDLLRACWHAIEKVTILDPTCGSGAFLFAALNILEPLYEACLDRMGAFVEDLARSGEKHRPEKFADFRMVLERIAAHPNRRYFILKSVILNNLFGVDIMEEAVEICKLRLFLKLAAQVEPDTARDNLGIEPLPDIDFNIRAGNTLVGYATPKAVKQALTSKLDFDNAAEKIAISAADLQQAFDAFRSRQVEGDNSVPARDKQELRKRLKALDDELNRYLASQYGVERSTKDALAIWVRAHQPFHWYVEFHSILIRGGFDVIIGNPPFVEYSKVRDSYRVCDYATEECANLYAFVIERSASLIHTRGRLGLITPIALVSVGEAKSARELLSRHFAARWFSNFAIRPAKLFEGVEQRLTLLLAGAGTATPHHTYSTKYLQWYKDERPTLFDRLEYFTTSGIPTHNSIPKLGSRLSSEVIRKVLGMKGPVVANGLVRTGRAKLYFHRTPGYWIRIMDFEPHFSSPTATRSIHHIRELATKDDTTAKIIGAAISSSLYFVWFFALGNCRNLTLEDVRQFPLGEPSHDIVRKAATLFDALMTDYQTNSFINYRGDTEFQEFNWGLSKRIIDGIDMVLGEHYMLCEDELDFVINYDIKIRMGRESDSKDQ